MLDAENENQMRSLHYSTEWEKTVYISMLITEDRIYEAFASFQFAVNYVLVLYTEI
jgi:hypothetical protein